MDSVLRSAALDLVWSLWTELGVPGPERRHAGCDVDPEVLVIASPHLAASDPRLLEEVARWCLAHGAHLSVTRLQGLMARTSPAMRAAFASFSAELRRLGGPRWPGAGEARGGPTLRPRSAPPPLPMERAALFRLRLRSLVGVGTRADVLFELLARGDHWMKAGDFADLGYSRRGISLTLAELCSGLLLMRRSTGRSVEVRLQRAEALSRLLGDWPHATPRWRLVFALVELGLELDDLAGKSEGFQRIAAVSVRERAAQIALFAGAPMPPPVAENPRLYPDLVEWARARVAGAGLEGSRPPAQPAP